MGAIAMIGYPPDHDARAAAFDRLFHPKMFRAVRRWLARLRVPSWHRGDVAGQVWLSAWASWSRFDPARSTAERWLNGITVHHASHYHERAQHRREQLYALIDMADPAPDAAAMVQSCRIRIDIIDALLELDPDLRSVLVAHDLEEIPMSKISEDTGIPVSTLYGRRARAMEALRSVVQRREIRTKLIRKARTRSTKGLVVHRACQAGSEGAAPGGIGTRSELPVLMNSIALLPLVGLQIDDDPDARLDVGRPEGSI